MFLIAFIVGTVLALVVRVELPVALLAGVGGVAVAFAAQFVIGSAMMRRGRMDAPVDLAAPIPEPLTRASYQSLPLAARNAVVARAVAHAAASTPEHVAGLLAEMMGRTRMSNIATQRGAHALLLGTSAARVDIDRYNLILESEVEMAAATAMPPTDRVRAIAERNLGQAVTPELMRTAVLTTRFPLLGRLSVAEMMDQALVGQIDLAFVVGSIRKVGEKHQQGLARL